MSDPILLHPSAASIVIRDRIVSIHDFGYTSGTEAGVEARTDEAVAALGEGHQAGSHGLEQAAPKPKTQVQALPTGQSSSPTQASWVQIGMLLQTPTQRHPSGQSSSFSQVQAPLRQASPAQTFPHRPQLFGSLAKSTHWPLPQSVWPAGQPPLPPP